MNGWEIFHHAVARMAECSREVLAREGLTRPTSPSSSPTRPTRGSPARSREKLGLREEQVVDEIAERGNTSAATDPARPPPSRRRRPRARQGAVLLSAFGAGLAWGATVLHYGDRS